MPLSGALQIDLGQRLSDYHMRIYVPGLEPLITNTDSVVMIVGVPDIDLTNNELSNDSNHLNSGIKKFLEPIPSRINDNIDNSSLLNPILVHIDKLMQCEDPPISDISHAKEIMEEFALYVNIGQYSVDTPFIHINEDNCVSIEWRNSGKTLYFEIENQIAEFTKVWRDGKKTIARSGLLNRYNYKEVWEWLINE